MALNASLDIGIKGSAVQKHIAGQIIVHAVRHLIETPRDPKTGMPTGKPEHGTLVVTKNVDLASNGLRQAMLSGKQLGKGTLYFFRLPPAGGQEETHYSIEFEDVRVISIRHVSLINTYAAFNLIPDQEEVRFTYKNITWNYHGTERGANNNNTKVNTTGSEDAVNAAPDELDDWAKDVLMGVGAELQGYVRDTVKLQFANLIKEIKEGPQEVPPAEE